MLTLRYSLMSFPPSVPPTWSWSYPFQAVFWIMFLSCCSRSSWSGMYCPRPGPWYPIPLPFHDIPTKSLFRCPSIQMRARMSIPLPLFRYYPRFWRSHLALAERPPRSHSISPLAAVATAQPAQASGVQQTRKSKIVKAPNSM